MLKHLNGCACDKTLWTPNKFVPCTPKRIRCAEPLVHSPSRRFASALSKMASLDPKDLLNGARAILPLRRVFPPLRRVFPPLRFLIFEKTCDQTHMSSFTAECPHQEIHVYFCTFGVPQVQKFI